MSFATSVGQWVKKTKEEDKAVYREVLGITAQALTTGHPLVPMSRSPVDTGLFQGNWKFSHGFIDLNPVDTLDKAGGVTLNKLLASIQRALPGNYHYFSNNVPYALRLEGGYSKQAPSGMVRITAMASSQILAQAVRNVKRRSGNSL